MLRTFLVFVFCSFFLCASDASAQQFLTTQSREVAWKCHGWVWIGDTNLFCADAKTDQLSKVGLDGSVKFTGLPIVGGVQPKAVLAVAEDSDDNFYVVDGLRIFAYSPDGRFQKAITPGVQMSMGIVAIDSQHFFVAGGIPPRSKDSKPTIFRVGPDGIEQQFSDVFVKGLSGTDDYVVNGVSFLALDRTRGLLYQVGQNSYEIRVFDLNGSLLRTIASPSQYPFKPGQIEHFGKGSALAPGDAISDVVVLSNGGLAINGDTLDFAEVDGKKTTVSYSRFVDLYDANGTFLRRLRGADLTLNGGFFTGFDHKTGKAYFRNDAKVIEANLHQ
jgi:hypothetical protein